MTDLDRATRTQIATIERKTGATLETLLGTMAGWGRDTHGQLVARANAELGHGDANLLAQLHRQRTTPAAPGVDPLETELAAMYTGRKASLRATHDRDMARIAELGPFEVSSKKSYLSLRMRTHFATVDPGSRGRPRSASR